MATTKITSPELFDLASLDSALQLPSGSTAQRPTSPSTGEWRYNTDNNLIEFYDGSAWIDLQDEDLPPVPSENFNTVLYTGTGSTQSITGVGFQPDFVWIKSRDRGTTPYTGSNYVYDSTRGSLQRIKTESSDAESTFANSLTSFNSDGFSLGSASNVNYNGDDFVAWCFKANGGNTSSNTDGTITSTVQANTRAGFSIVKHTNSGSKSDSVGHGLGVAPEILITKKYTISSSWWVYTTLIDGSYDYIQLNGTGAKFDSSGLGSPTSTVFYNESGTADGAEYITYCFHSVQGYSKFGTYTGNGSTNGPVVETGFEPAFLLIRRTDSADNWLLFDNKRNASNPRNLSLIPNSTAAESVGNLGNGFAFLNNGFQVVSSDSGVNGSGGTYLYMAFAADPSSEPTLANSFYQTSYTGNGATRSFTGFGFQPMISWIKRTDGGRDHIFTTWCMLSLYNRTGANDFARTNSSTISSSSQQIISYDPDGVTMGNYVGVNYNNTYDYIGWFWKGSTLPTINNDGSTQTIISLNKAAGMSVIHYSGNGVSGTTLGHGLDQTPEFIYYWPYSVGNAKRVKSEAIGFAGFSMFTSGDSAKGTSSEFNNTAPTSSVITTNAGLGINYSGQYYNMMVFHSVDGFSKFGSYTGTGAAGNTVNIGFQPTFVMLKSISVVGNWVIIDSSYADSYLAANTTNGFLSLIHI